MLFDIRVVEHPIFYYVLTTFHGLNTLHSAPLCRNYDIFNSLCAKYNPRKTLQNTAIKEEKPQ